MPIQPVIISVPVISTAYSKFGGSSLFIPYKTAARHLDYSGKGLIFYPEFTLEFFLRFNQPSGTGGGVSSVVGFSNNLYFTIPYIDSDCLQCAVFDSSGVFISTFTLLHYTKPTSKFYHIAVTRSVDNYYRFFVDGVMVNEVYNVKLVNPNGSFIVGNNTVGMSSFYIDELRFKNECVYVDNFTPPSAPFQTYLKTLLLLHFDGLSGSQLFIDSSDIGVCDTPAASVPSGDYSSPFYVALSCITLGSVIYYRIDSGDWIQSDLIQIQNSCTVQVKAVRNDLQHSDILTLNYIVKCSLPVFNLDSGFYSSAIQIVLSNNDGHNIYYKIGSGEWIQGDNILIDSACVVYAKCTDSGLQDSDIISRVFNFMSAGSGGGTEIDLTDLITSVDGLGGKIDNLNNNIGGLAASNEVIIRNMNLD